MGPTTWRRWSSRFTAGRAPTWVGADTLSRYGGKLDRAVDALHFAPSRHSRLLQAADLVSFLHFRIRRTPEADPRSAKASANLWDIVDHQVRTKTCGWAGSSSGFPHLEFYSAASVVCPQLGQQSHGLAALGVVEPRPQGDDAFLGFPG